MVSSDSGPWAWITISPGAESVPLMRPRLLASPPVVSLDVTAPEAQAGDITGGLASKRARINGTDAMPGEIVIHAHVPLSELTDYAAELKSATAGRGRYSLDFSHYEPVPSPVQQRLMAAHHPQVEDD